ncbi:MAG TPA: chorismate lyase [Gammaproteobacteria bacterium]|nr:chorismate lyase [Gammaproteobacteria bacterium]
MSFRFLHDLDWVKQLSLLNPNELERSCLENKEFTTQLVQRYFGQLQSVEILFNGIGRLHRHEESVVGSPFSGIREVCLSVADNPWMLARTVCTENCLLEISAEPGPLGIYLANCGYGRTSIEYAVAENFSYQGVSSKAYLRRNKWSLEHGPDIMVMEIFLRCLDFNPVDPH